MPPNESVTQLLLRAADEKGPALDQLFDLVYADLRGVAERSLGGERSDHTLQATALVHEAYLRLVDQTRCDWKNRAHFLAIAAMAMRRILVDHARRRSREKRGGGWEKLSLDEALELPAPRKETSLVALDEALEKLGQREPEKARVVEMRFFAGLSNEECAAVLGVSSKTITRYWDYAQAWLYREIARGPHAA